VFGGIILLTPIKKPGQFLPKFMHRSTSCRISVFVPMSKIINGRKKNENCNFYRIGFSIFNYIYNIPFCSREATNKARRVDKLHLCLNN